MKQAIVVSDDFGFTEGINRGCVDAFQNGILTEMSFMVDSPGSEHGAKICKDNGINHNVGIHITLNDMNKTGKYLRTPEYDDLLANSTTKDLQSRVQDEFKKFEDLFGRVPSHINGHHNSHSHHKTRDVIAEYAKKHGIPVRRYRPFTDGNVIEVTEDPNPFFKSHGIKMTDYIFEHIKSTYEEAFEGFISELESVPDGKSAELFVHIAHVDDTLLKYSSLNWDREKRDLKLLKDPKFKQEILNLGFEIVGFDGL